MRRHSSAEAFAPGGRVVASGDWDEPYGNCSRRLQQERKENDCDRNGAPNGCGSNHALTAIWTGLTAFRVELTQDELTSVPAGIVAECHWCEKADSPRIATILHRKRRRGMHEERNEEYCDRNGSDVRGRVSCHRLGVRRAALSVSS